MWAEFCNHIKLDTEPSDNKLSEEALELVYDFIKYSELYPNDMADIMYYDVDRFKRKLKQLKKQIGV